MPSKMPNLGARATKEFIAALDAHIQSVGFKGKRSDYILGAITERMKREAATKVPAAKAPHGVRNDSLPLNPDGTSWKSRLYPDRYQLVAIWNGAEFEIYNLHESPAFNKSRIFGNLRADEIAPNDGNKIEVTILDVPQGIERERVTETLRYELMAWISEIEG